MSVGTDYEQLREQPSLFVESILDVEPFGYQQEFLDSDNDRKAFRSGRQVGKSRCCAWYGLAHAVCNPYSEVLITAPSLRQSSNLFSTLRSEMNQSGIADDEWGIERDTQTIIEFDNGSEIHCLPTGRNGNQIRGHSANLIIVDEAAFIEDQIFEDVLEPMTFATNGDIVLASTPFGTSGYFYRKSTDPGWYAKRVPSTASPLVDEEDIERFKEGKTRNQIKREVLGKFVEDGSSYFDTPLIKEAFGTPAKRTDDVYLGADIAATGADETVFVFIDGQFNVFDTEVHDDIGVLDAADRIESLHNNYGFETIAVDRTGLGQGTVEKLQDRSGLWRTIEDFYLTIQKKQSVYQSLKTSLEEERLTIPDERTLYNQLEAIGFDKRNSGNISIQPRENMHDDWVDALALAVHVVPGTEGKHNRTGARGSTSVRTLGDMRGSNTPQRRDESPTTGTARRRQQRRQRTNRR